MFLTYFQLESCAFDSTENKLTTVPCVLCVTLWKLARTQWCVWRQGITKRRQLNWGNLKKELNYSTIRGWYYQPLKVRTADEIENQVSLIACSSAKTKTKTKSRTKIFVCSG